MATVMKLRWEGVAPDQYDALRPVVNWETDPPDGLIFHTIWFRDGGATVVDVWESREQFERFLAERLSPGFQQVGLSGEPHVKFYEAHAYFSPALQRV